LVPLAHSYKKLTASGDYVSSSFAFIFFCSTLSEFENFLLCERILINVTTLSKRNVKLILKILSDLEPFKGVVKQKNVVFN
jgi:hypothetical protein